MREQMANAWIKDWSHGGAELKRNFDRSCERRGHMKIPPGGPGER